MINSIELIGQSGLYKFNSQKVETDCLSNGIPTMPFMGTYEGDNFPNILLPQLLTPSLHTPNHGTMWADEDDKVFFKFKLHSLWQRYKSQSLPPSDIIVDDSASSQQADPAAHAFLISCKVKMGL